MAPACTTELHADIVADPARFRGELIFLGVQELDDARPPLELRNCPRCFSTLALELADVG